MNLRIAVINKTEVNNQPVVPLRGTDLSMVIAKEDVGHISMLNNNDLVELRLSDEEAFERAESYVQHFTVRTLQETIGIDLRCEGYSNDFSEEVADTYASVRDVYVMTNNDNVLGAAVLTRQEILRELHARIGDYYILPSSKHEVLAISKQFSPDIEDLKAMVQTINLTTVRPEDRLSDNVYAFDGKSLTIAKADDKTIDNEVSKYQGRTMA